MVPNCGNGRSDCATVEVDGKPAYGALNPRLTAVVEPICDVSKERSAALLRSLTMVKQDYWLEALQLKILLAD